ncbi:MAG: hypothetical protein QOK43_323 [Acidimicrobiaceae bacterium]|nr:hypothetical protein [Acidimicrobiaceae bacterium]MDQ1443586.1 hypothetical protein [Acidimicrobiaceae bacterium]
MTEAETERGGFEALYARFADHVFRYAVRRSANEADAEDVLAETFAVCWRRLGDVPAGKELPWLYGVARRVLANQRRSSGRLDRLRARLQSEQIVGRSGTAEDGMALDVLDRLPEGDQEVLRLALWEGLAPSEIAVVLGVTENAVYIRLHRARQRFAAAFGQAGGGQR